MWGRNQNLDVSMTNLMDGWLPLKQDWKPEHFCLEGEAGTLWIRSSRGPGLCRSTSGAPLMSSKGMSVCDPEGDADFWCSCRCPCFVQAERGVEGGMESGESASSPAKDRLLHRGRTCQSCPASSFRGFTCYRQTVKITWQKLSCCYNFCQKHHNFVDFIILPTKKVWCQEIKRFYGKRKLFSRQRLTQIHNYRSKSLHFANVNLFCFFILFVTFCSAEICK